MTYRPTELLTVYLEIGERVKVGRLARVQRQILFEYDPAFLPLGIEISPLKLPLGGGVLIAPDIIFDGLFGVFNDSLPDGWGRLLLDRAVEQHGIRRGQMNSLDRLAFVGRNGMGALSYEPERGQSSESDIPLSLDRLAEGSAIVLAGETGEVFEELLRLSGSSSGARPKIVAQVSADRKTIFYGGQANLKPGFEHWMIKLASSHDRRDTGAIEYAYNLMADDAGVEVPEAHFFRTRKRAYFGVKRFDRKGERRIHMHSLSGLIHADHRVPALDYDLILRVVVVLTKNIVQVEKAYALACFNVLAHNRDDHSKNFSFLLDDNQQWIFAPGYDLTFSDGPGGEQSTMVMGEGKSPGIDHLVALGKEHNLRQAQRILAKVQAAVARWKDHASLAGVSAKSMKAIAGRICGA